MSGASSPPTQLVPEVVMFGLGDDRRWNPVINIGDDCFMAAETRSPEEAWKQAHRIVRLLSESHPTQPAARPGWEMEAAREICERFGQTFSETKEALSTRGQTLRQQRRRVMPKFKRSQKSQADLISLLESRGWQEDQGSHNEWRWYKQAYPGVLFTLRGAVSLENSLQIGKAFRTMRRR